MSLKVDIQKKFKGFTLDIRFENRGEGALGILGASGCGKSMTLKCIAGIETPDRGKIILNDQVLFDSEKRINRKPQERRVGYLFQDYALFPNMTVEQNVACAARRPKRERGAYAAGLIKRFGLAGQEKKYPSQLSGGQKQRTALARIMANEPEVLFLDEPFSAMDAYLREQLLLRLEEILEEYDGDTILVTHSRDEVYRACKRLLIMDAGQAVCKGETKKIFEKPEYFYAARVTGCKNLSPARRISDHELEALDWGVRLKTADPVSADTSFVGIRAHYFYAPEPGQREENVFCPVQARVSEAPFEENVIFYTEAPRKQDKEIWWKMDKETWEKHLGGIVPARICVKPEDILVLR